MGRRVSSNVAPSAIETYVILNVEHLTTLSKHELTHTQARTEIRPHTYNQLVNAGESKFCFHVSIQLLIIISITNHEQSDVTCCALTELSGDVSRGSPHTASCFPSHEIMAHRLEFFDGTYVTKICVYVSLGWVLLNTG